MIDHTGIGSRTLSGPPRFTTPLGAHWAFVESCRLPITTGLNGIGYDIDSPVF
jgi:hypothetical protein